MHQQSLTTDGFEKYLKPTRKEIFLKDMEQIIPWKELCQVIKPYYPKPKGAGRRPVGLEKECFAYIFCSTGLRFLIPRQRKLYMTPMP